MARILPKKDVVIIGLGWTGSIMAQELTDEGLDVQQTTKSPPFLHLSAIPGVAEPRRFWQGTWRSSALGWLDDPIESHGQVRKKPQNFNRSRT